MLRSCILICFAAAVASAQGRATCPSTGKVAPASKRSAPEEVPVERPLWRAVERVSPVTVTGEAAPAEAPRHERPLLVYVYDASDPEARFRVEDMKVFGDPKVACAVRFFDCAKVEQSEAAKDPALAGKPCFVLVRRDYRADRSLPHAASARRLFGALNRLLRKEHKVNAETVLRRHKKLRREYAVLRARLDHADDDAKEALEAKLDKIEEKEAALYTLDRD